MPRSQAHRILISHRQQGHWLPEDRSHHRAWLSKHYDAAKANPQPLHPVLQDFKEAVEGDSRLYMLFRQSMDQVSFPYSCKLLTRSMCPNGCSSLRSRTTSLI